MPEKNSKQNNDNNYYAEIDFLSSDIPTTQSTGKKARTWFHYHRLLLVVAALTLVILGYFISFYTRKDPEPDYRIAVISTIAIPEDTADSLQKELTAYGTDQNGDGKVLIQLNRYVVDLSENEDADLASSATGKIQLSSDLQSDECSSIFLTVDPESLEKSTGLLLNLDGTLPDKAAASSAEDWQNMCLSWNSCPVLSSLNLGQYTGYTVLDKDTGSSQEVMSDFYICRRNLETEEQKANNKGADELWEALTAR